MKYKRFADALELVALDEVSMPLARNTKKRRRERDDLLYLAFIDAMTVDRAPVQPSHRFTFATVPDATLYRETRFEREIIVRIHHGLNLPAVIVAPNRSRFTSLDGLFVLLYRLASPNKLYSMERDLGWREAQLSVIVNQMLILLHPIVVPLLTNRSPWMRSVHLRQSAQHIGNAFQMPQGSPIVGFIDAKIWVTCKPVYGETSVYNGKDRVHGLKWQSVIDCFGLICHFYGGLSARRHDALLYQESGVYPLLEANLQGHILGLFGDLAYPRSNRLLKPYARVGLTPARIAFNRWYSLLRVVVEWGFSKVVALFPFTDYEKKLKILLVRVTPMVDVAAFFTNCHTLVYGSQVSDYFQTRDVMPTLESYFR